MTPGVRQYEMGQCVSGQHTPVSPPTEDEITDTASMRKFLLKQMVKAAKGQIDTAKVKNVCSLAQQVFQATKLEIEAAKTMKAGFAPTPLALTDDKQNG